MLVLSRKVGQRIVIGENITVVVNRVAGNRVTLGIEAPDNVHIMRGELERHQREFRFPVEERVPATVPLALEVELDDPNPCLPRLAR
ncbi:MAG: carbon storage regulator [Pirellulaceae bacterium]|nr:carbon storage regulator [Pirellulaceae bacterium]